MLVEGKIRLDNLEALTRLMDIPTTSPQEATVSTCATPNCTSASTGKSKYCTPHKAQAREAWKAMIAAKDGERAEREERWADLHAKASQAGREAAEARVPTPMVVVQHQNMFDETSPVVYREVVPGGVCGFAWIKVGPGNSSFARWLSKNDIASKAYGGGVMVWVSGYGQSMEQKEAFAQAYARVVREAEPKLKVYAQSRMD